MTTLREELEKLAQDITQPWERDLTALALAAANLALEAAARECEAPELECCGCPVIGAEYMGAQEQICCGQPEVDEKSAKQCAAAIRAMRLGNE